MNTKLYVGNLPFTMNETDLEELFAESGKVASVSMPLDRATGRKRGFAFVEMESQQDAEAAIKALNGQSVDGRDIVVNPSRPKTKSW